MEATDLDREIQAYEQLLPTIRKSHGPGWAMVANCAFVNTFSSFAIAVKYARENFGTQEVLIRHTDERAQETAPFLHVHAS